MLPGNTRKIQLEGRPFRKDFHLPLLEEITRCRALALGRHPSYRVLSYPSEDSPFLTLAERVGQEVPAYVLKVLVIREEDREAFAWWKEQVLDVEQKRLSEEFNRRLNEPRMRRDEAAGRQDQDDAAALLLALPVSHPLDKDLVRQETTDFLHAGLLLAEGHADDAQIKFHYLVRPYVAWPTLREVVLSRAERIKCWQKYCEEKGIPQRIADHRDCLNQFCQEALICEDDLFLTSAWRWGRITDRPPWVRRLRAIQRRVGSLFQKATHRLARIRRP